MGEVQTTSWVPEPDGPINVLVGYGRSSDDSLDFADQTTTLLAAGCERVFIDTGRGRGSTRPQLTECLDYLRAKDVLVVTDLARLGQSLADLVDIVVDVRRREVGLRSLSEGIDTSEPGGRLVFHIFVSLAEFARELTSARTRGGLDKARARGQRLGRPPALDDEQIRQARLLLTRPDESVASIARLLGVSRTTLYKHVPELRSDAGGRQGIAATETGSGSDQAAGRTAGPAD